MKCLKVISYCVAALSVLLFGGCSGMKDVKITACSVESVSLSGLRGVKGRLILTVDNPSSGFTLSDINGVLYRNGSEFALFSSEPVEIQPRTIGEYPLEGEVRLSDQVSIMQILPLLGKYDISEFSVDLHARVKLRSGLGKKVVYKDIPLAKLIDSQ